MTIEDKETKRQSRLFQSCLREELSSCTHLTSEEERERDADFCINSANQKLSKVLNWFELKFRRIQTLPVFLTLSLSLSFILFDKVLPKCFIKKVFLILFDSEISFQSMTSGESQVFLYSPSPSFYYYLFWKFIFASLPWDQFSSGNGFLKSWIASSLM